MQSVRLDRFLANAGEGTRTEVKKMIRLGMICVNGRPAGRPEEKIIPSEDTVTVNGKPVTGRKPVWIMLYKPAGVITATKDNSQSTVLDLMPEEAKGLFPVGRLDKDTEGLLLLTDEGETAHDLLSPRHHVNKIYEALVEGLITEKEITCFAEGIGIGDAKKTAPSGLEIIKCGFFEELMNEQDPLAQRFGQLSAMPPENTVVSHVRVIVSEGRYHQIKRMFTAVGSTVLYLKRIGMGRLFLDPMLRPGEYRALTPEETDLLMRKRHPELKKVDGNDAVKTEKQ